MATAAPGRRYRSTESKYKGGAHESYITYDLEQRTRGGTALYPHVKRVYIAGDITGWKVGDCEKRSGRKAHGVKVDYTQSRAGYSRQGYTARRGGAVVQIPPSTVKSAVQHFSLVVDVPKDARNIEFHKDGLPAHYREALQDIK